MKHIMEQDASSSTRSVMEAQLSQLIKAVMDSSNTTITAMRQSTQEVFVELRSKLDYVYNVFLKRALESVVV